MSRAMFEYTKTVLKKVSFDTNLFCKEVQKALLRLLPYEIEELKLFIQVNIGNEEQKSGVSKNHLTDLYKYCKELNLDVIGLMCIPPANCNPEQYFIKLRELNKLHGLKELSMGMSSDYKVAIKCGSTFVRIGSSIFN